MFRNSWYVQEKELQPLPSGETKVKKVILQNSDMQSPLCKLSSMKIATPKFDILSDIWNSVYEPAEDTFLLIDALEKDLPQLTLQRPAVICEIGCGSGVVISAIAGVFTSSAFCLCTDINPSATKATKATAQMNAVCVEPVITDLACCFNPRLHGKIDLLIFNPPYVITPDSEVSTADGEERLRASWAGGQNGRRVIDRFLPSVPLLLSETGVFYLVITAENRQDEIEKMMARYGLSCSVVAARRAGAERLSVLKFSRK